MKMRDLTGRLSALALALLLSVQGAAPALAAGETVYIRSAEDLLELTERCSLDAWSRGKTVVLAADVSLDSVDFRPIPTFGGVFEGGGHTISGLTQSGKLSPAGVFGVVQEGAVIRDLNVRGNVTPGGSGSVTGGVAGENRGVITGCGFFGTVTGSDRTGGVAGVNALTGRIEKCTVTGSVTGGSMTGGVTGENRGVVLSCQNRSYVNITSVDPGVDLSGMELTARLLTLQTLDAVNIATDTGGVAGYSDGMLLNCVNEGVVGYQHVGYNVGGIAGRSSGFVSGCVNRGRVFGRKDVGGIVGQAEPYVVPDLSKDTLSAVQSQLSELEDRIDRAERDAQSVSDTLSASFSEVNDALDDAVRKVQTLSDRLTGYGGDVVDEVDRSSAILAAALDDLADIADDADGLPGLLTQGLELLEESIRDLQKTGDYTDPAAKELESAADDIGSAVSLLKASHLTENMKTLSDALQTPEISDDRAALDAVSRSLDYLSGENNRQGFLNLLNTAAEHLKKAMNYLGRASDQAQTALDTLAEALSVLARASGQSERVMDGAHDLIDYLAGVDPIQIVRPDEAIGSASDDLFDALTLLGDRLDRLNAAANESSNQLTGDLRAVNSQFSLLMDTVLNAAADLENRRVEDKITDASEADVESVTSGKVRGCVNEGDVSGDLCVGGVAGSLSVEYELDPEDDTLDGALSYRRSYELKAILQNCSSNGAVTARRDWAGAVCGRMNLGLALNCLGGGTVESESGDYVGGVAGFSVGAVRGCWAKCILSGGKYVGGVVGAAALEGADDDGGVVADCRSFVEIRSCEQYAGAISGVDRGTFRDNFFVSDQLAGIGRTSLLGQAEPVAYEALIQMEGAPSAFRELTLRFLSDGEALKTVAFRYGDSFDESIYPALPEKEGFYTRWDTEKLENLRFDTDVTAVFTPRRIALASEEVRSDGRPVLFVEGQFAGEDALSLQSGGAEGAARSTAAHLRREVEVWNVTVPEDGAAVHTLRYLSKNGSPNRLEVYALTGTEWHRLETQSAGSYLLFDAEGSALTLAVVSQKPIWWIWLAAAAALAALLLLAWLLAGRWKEARKKKPEGQKAAPDPRRKRRRILAVLSAALAVSCVLAGVFFAKGGMNGAAAVQALYEFAKQEECAVELTAQADVGPRRHSGAAELTRLQMSGREVTVVRQMGAAAYYSDGTVYLENGAAFRLGGEALPDYAALLGTVKVLYQAGDIRLFKNGEERIYSISVEGEDAQRLLLSLFPAGAEYAALEKLDVDLKTVSGRLRELRFTANGALNGGETASLLANLTVLEEWTKPEIPTAVREAILSGGEGAEENAAAALHLLSAWGKLNMADPFAAQMTLSADCGPLVLHEDVELYRTWVDGKAVSGVCRSGRTLYFSEGKLYQENGESLNIPDNEEAVSRVRLLELAYGLCLRGEADCREQNGRYLYTLRLPPDELAEIAGDVLPAVKALDVTFTDGELELTVAEDAIESLRLRCGGTLRVLFADVQVELSGEAHFEPRDFSLPEDVAAAVRRGA